MVIFHSYVKLPEGSLIVNHYGHYGWDITSYRHMTI